MEKIIKCPKCGSEKQVKRGKNPSGTQKYFCNDCGGWHTPEPKKHAYSEEERKEAIKMYFSGVSGRGVANFFGFNKANVYNWLKKTTKS